MIPRLNISFPLENQKQFWFGKAYSSQAGEYLLNQNMAQHTWYGENAFMLIAQTEKPKVLKNHLLQHGVETATHFSHAIDWAQEFGYTKGSCPTAEQLTKKLLMIPTYCQKASLKIKV